VLPNSTFQNTSTIFINQNKRSPHSRKPPRRRYSFMFFFLCFFVSFLELRLHLIREFEKTSNQSTRIAPKSLLVCSYISYNTFHQHTIPVPRKNDEKQKQKNQLLPHNFYILVNFFFGTKQHINKKRRSISTQKFFKS
jgi:hypothetical protein